MEKLDSHLIFEVLNHLRSNQVDSKSIYNVLKLLCEKAFFSSAAIYEINHDKFYLAEFYNISVDSLDPVLVLENIDAEDKVCYLSKNSLEECSGVTKQLFDIYNAKTLYMLPIIDEEQNVQGFITVFNVLEERVLDNESQEILIAILYALLHYVDRRIYIRKFDSNMSTLDVVLNNSGIDVYVNDYDTHDILYVNQSMAEPYGGTDKLMGRKCWGSLFPGQPGPCDFCPKYHIVNENKEPSQVYSWDCQRAFDGAWFRVFSAAFYWWDGRLAHVVTSVNITDNKKNEERIENLANYDQLTQLPNRRMLLKDCKSRIDNASVSEKGFVLFFDIDRFKKINDNYGHDAGDDFLVKLGHFFSDIPILKDSIYRNGGDEFIAIIGGENYTENNVKDFLSFILNRFKDPWIIKGNEIYCNISIGVARFPEDGTVAEDLIQIADQAMYHIKKSGGANMCFGYQLKK